jgi:hypothetical protein
MDTLQALEALYEISDKVIPAINDIDFTGADADKFFAAIDAARSALLAAKQVEGTWSPDDIRRAFVEGAKWWEYAKTGGTMWQSDIDHTEEVATKRYPLPPLPEGEGK